MLDSEQCVTALQQGQHVKEIAELKQKLDVKLLEANNTKSEHEQQIMTLQQQISQLKLEHEGHISKHMTEHKQSLTEADAARDAAIKVDACMSIVLL